MATRTGDSPSYVDSGPSTTVPEKKSNDFEPTYDIDPGTGEAERDTSKPTRKKYYFKRVESP